VGGLLNLLARGAGLVLGADAVREVSVKLAAETRPMVKTAIRAGLSAGERLEAWTAGAREQFEDLVAEARAEQRGDDQQRGQ
jgi:hypothetical protein